MAQGTGAGEEIAIGAEAAPPEGIWGPSRGPILFQCMIPTRAYPWKAPKVSMCGRVRKKSQSNGYQRWKSWSSDVAMVLMVHHQLHRGHCFEGVVDLDILFVLERDAHPPDRTNLLKATEDVLERIVYLNDRQVQGGDARRVFIGQQIIGHPEGVQWEGPERIHMRVTSLG